ncbi:MAG: putative DNA binding domain-containing protein [Bacteroidota bacterium]|nr:putative DNA binding domain-containing protein [Bacteroidota bacterium]MDE2644543.1 putative DNA binding domain-containing protein [Bacteroidota bacterium]
MNIPDLVRRLCAHPREKEWFEFKSSYDEPEKLGQNISAIANAAAISERPNGYIIWGIRDEDHQIVGTRFKPDSKRVKKDDLDHWLSQRLDPLINFRFLTDEVDGKPVVVLLIPRALDRPVRFDNEAYIRVGSHTRKLNSFPEKESLLWRLSSSRTFESGGAIECVNNTDVLGLLDYESYFNLAKIPIPSSTTNLLQSLQHENFISQRDDGSWDILNLGFLAFARNLGDINSLRRKSPRIVKYSGTGRYNGSRQEELPVGYATGFASIIDYVNKLAPTDETFNGGIRKQEPRFPTAAVREVIANALIHQDLTERGTGPLVEIFEDRIEVLNPGAPLVDSKLFVNAPPKSRNEALAALLRRFGICEELGSGWDKIVHEIEMRQLPAPRIDVISNSTRVTVYGAKPLSKMNSDDRIRAIYLHACLRYADEGASITNTTVRQRFGMDRRNSAKASRFLSEALAAGDIVPANPNAGRRFMEYLPYWAGGDADGQGYNVAGRMS